MVLSFWRPAQSRNTSAGNSEVIQHVVKHPQPKNYQGEDYDQWDQCVHLYSSISLVSKRQEATTRNRRLISASNCATKAGCS